MPFDPSKPAFGSPDSSAEMREQFAGLKQLIDATPTITAVVVDSVNTLPPGSPATVDANITANVLHLVFGIPQGAPFGGVTVDGVDTLNPGDAATAGVVFDGVTVRFVFGIPRGADGTNGADGPQGIPGEVSNDALSAAINEAIITAVGSSSANTNAVPTLDTPFVDPDTESLRQAFNMLVLALRR